MSQIDVFTDRYRHPKTRLRSEAELCVRDDMPQTDVDVVVRFYEATRRGSTLYGVVRVLAARVAELRREVAA